MGAPALEKKRTRPEGSWPGAAFTRINWVV